MKYLTLKIICLTALVIVNDGLAAESAKKSGDQDNYTSIMSNKFDFSETGISGEKRGPDDFFLRGQQSQSLSQMVRLREGFKREHRNSRYGVKALSH